MKYYLIAGEASGDLHASLLMRALKERDPQAEFRYFGGDCMAAAGGTLVRHYRTLAFMGFIPVLLHLRTILGGLAQARRDIAVWRPDAVILTDYPGFNMKIAKYVKTRGIAPVCYYIAPKIWAWKEYRIKSIRRYVDTMLSILPFEPDYFRQRHNYTVDYVGNPTRGEVDAFLRQRGTDGGAAPAGSTDFPDDDAPIIALLAGSRQQEIRANLPAMLKAVARYAATHHIIIAGAPGFTAADYAPYTAGHPEAGVVFGQTYELLARSEAALVTSGTATLETALLGVPQVVCYETGLHLIFGFLRRHVLRTRFVSLVNLIAGREVVREVIAEDFSTANIGSALADIMPGGSRREPLLQGYAEVRQRLGTLDAPQEAARIIAECCAN